VLGHPDGDDPLRLRRDVGDPQGMLDLDRELPRHRLVGRLTGCGSLDLITTLVGHNGEIGGSQPQACTVFP
jgi:hypothetical protein